METRRAKILRDFNVAIDASGVAGRAVVQGTIDDVPVEAFDGLKAEGYVAEADPFDHDGDGKSGGSTPANPGAEVMTPAALVAAIAADPPMEWNTFKAEAARILGADLPSKKVDIIAALQAMVDAEAAKIEG